MKGSEVEAVETTSEIGELNSEFRGVGWNSFSQEGMFLDSDAVIVQSDGKIVVGGSRLNGFQYDPMMVRFHSNGLVDTSFGDDGIVVAEWPASEGIVGKVNEEGAGVDLGVLSDDRLALVSSPIGADDVEKHGVMLFTPDGVLDSSFSGDGRATVENWGQDMDVYTLAVHIDASTDRILVMGVAPNNSWDYKVNLLRFATNGSLDSTFSWHNNGKGGYLWPDTVDNIPHDITMRDHKIFVGGSSSTDWTKHHMSVMQLARDGKSYDWRIQIDVNGFGDSKAMDLTIQDSNKVVAAGWASVPGNYTVPAVVRVNSGGDLDTTFGGGDGKFTYDFGVDAIANSTIIDDQNRIVVGGNYDVYGDSKPFVMRLTHSGELDTTFGDNGIILYPTAVTGNSEWFMDLTRHGDRNVIASGVTGDGLLVTSLKDLYSTTSIPALTCDSISVEDGAGQTMSVSLHYWGIGEERTFDFTADSDNYTAYFRDHPAWWADADIADYVVQSWSLTVNGNVIDPGVGGLECHRHFTLNYDSNGGNTTPSNHKVFMGHNGQTAASIEVSAEIPDRYSYTFTGWNTEADGSGTSYTANDTYNVPAEPNTTATLYAQWDLDIPAMCTAENNLGMYQSITTDGVVTFKELDVVSGGYVTVPDVSLDLRPFGPWSNSAQINAAGVDPTTGKLFGAVNTGSTTHIIQFDLASPTPSVGWLGRFSSGNAWAADFLADGTYVFHDDSGSVNKLRSISNLSSLPVFETRTEAPVLVPATHLSSVFDNSGDITTVTKLDGTELLVGYDYPTNKVAVVDAADLDSGSLYTTALPIGFDTSGYADVVGAAWMNEVGDAFFSLNSGNGIYAVLAEDLDTDSQTAVLSATVVTSTEETNQNDGFGCPTVQEVPELNESISASTTTTTTTVPPTTTTTTTTVPPTTTTTTVPPTTTTTVPPTTTTSTTTTTVPPTTTTSTTTTTVPPTTTTSTTVPSTTVAPTTTTTTVPPTTTTSTTVAPTTTVPPTTTTTTTTVPPTTTTSTTVPSTTVAPTTTTTASTTTTTVASQPTTVPDTTTPEVELPATGGSSNAPAAVILLAVGLSALLIGRRQPHG